MEVDVRVVSSENTGGNATRYVIEITVPEGKFQVKKRYSELATLHAQFKKAGGSGSFPNFPPKKWFGNKKAGFVD
jgi:hypothetical protein